MTTPQAPQGDAATPRYRDLTPRQRKAVGQNRCSSCGRFLRYPQDHLSYLGDDRYEWRCEG